MLYRSVGSFPGRRYRLRWKLFQQSIAREPRRIWMKWNRFRINRSNHSTAREKEREGIGRGAVTNPNGPKVKYGSNSSRGSVPEWTRHSLIQGMVAGTKERVPPKTSRKWKQKWICVTFSLSSRINQPKKQSRNQVEVSKSILSSFVSTLMYEMRNPSYLDSSVA